MFTNVSSPLSHRSIKLFVPFWHLLSQSSLSFEQFSKTQLELSSHWGGKERKCSERLIYETICSPAPSAWDNSQIYIQASHSPGNMIHA